MKKQSIITEATKNNIINAFWELYKENDIDKISIQKIMDNAGYHRSTFYLYFTDIYDLLNCLEESIINGIKNKLDLIPEVTTDDISADLIKRITDIYSLYSEYLYILLGENGDSKFINKIKSTFKPMFYSIAGKNDEENNIQLDLLFEFSISALIGSLQYYYNHKDIIQLEDVILETRYILTHGIMAQLDKINK